eukprot:6419899-Amphidinium_carterae.1
MKVLAKATKVGRVNEVSIYVHTMHFAMFFGGISHPIYSPNNTSYSNNAKDNFLPQQFKGQ